MHELTFLINLILLNRPWFSCLFVFGRTIYILLLINQVVFRASYILNSIRLPNFWISWRILFIGDRNHNFFILLFVNNIVVHVFLIGGVLNILLQRYLFLNIFVYKILFLSIFVLFNALSFDEIFLLILLIVFILSTTSISFFLWKQVFRDFILLILLRLKILLVILLSNIKCLFFLFYFIYFLIPIFSTFIRVPIILRNIRLRNLRVWRLPVLVIYFNYKTILI